MRRSQSWGWMLLERVRANNLNVRGDVEGVRSKQRRQTYKR